MKNIKNYLLTALLALTLVFGITGITTLTKASAATELKANLNVGQDISLVISADIPNAGEVTATFAWNGKEAYSDTVVGEKQGEKDTYKFFYRGLSSQYMAKDVTVTVYNGTTEFDKATVSVKGILNTYLSSSAKDLNINANAYKKLTTLSADILNYGKAAESYLKLPDDIGEVTGGTTFVADETATSKASGNLKWNAGITFDYNLRPAVKVYIPAETYKDTLVAKIDGNVATLTATPTANVYTLTYSNYNILDIDKDYKFEIFDGETSLGSYTSKLAALAKESNAEIVKAAYVYGKSVVKYASVLENIDFVSEHLQAESAIKGGGSKVDGFSTWQYTTADGVIAKGSGQIANGAENQYLQALSGNTAWVATLNVTVEKAGEYDLRASVQNHVPLSLKDIFMIAVKQTENAATDREYAVSDTQDYCLSAGQWTNEYTANDWSNAYYWTDVSVGTVKLEEGKNVIYVKAAKSNTIPNIDYFYVKGFTTAEEKVTLVNTRNTFKTSLATHSEIGKTADEACLIKKGSALKELYKYEGGYPNNITGLYMVIPDMAYTYNKTTYTQTCKVPVTEDMITGLDYAASGIQTVTITYGEHSVQAYFRVFEPIVIEAEDCVYMLKENGAETPDAYTIKENNAIAEYYQDGTTTEVVQNKKISNGSSGKGAVSSLDRNGKKVYFKLSVDAPVKGSYKLKARAQGPSASEIKDLLHVNVNNAKDVDGKLIFTTNSDSQKLTAGNQLNAYCDTAGKNYTNWCNMFWWGMIDVGTFELNKGRNEIRVYMPNNFPGNIDYFELVAGTADGNEAPAIISYRSDLSGNLDGKILHIAKGTELTSVVPTPALHPAKYMLLYLRTSSGKEVPVLESMLKGKVDYNKVGEEQLVTVTDPVSKEEASFKLFIDADA